MNDILFSSWGQDIIDNRGKADSDCLPVKAVDLPEYFKRDEKIKALIGWYGLVLRSADVDVVDLSRAHMAAVADHSCGKCIPCRTGTALMAGILDRICSGRGLLEDLTLLRTLAQTVSRTSKCSIGKTGPIPLLHALEHFFDRFEQAVRDRQIIEAGQTHSRLTAPCMDACPIHLDIPQYIECIREARYDEALDVIRERLPLPGVVGRVCVRPCEENCRRANLDEPVSIKYLKRFVADCELDRQKTPEYSVEPSVKTGRVAIVGAGPAGVTCAYHLARKGHQVTVYERLGEPGGMSAVGIPDYRLPRKILGGEVAQVQKMGVTFHYNTTIGKEISLVDLESDNDAVFVGIGAQNSSAMWVEGEDKGYAGFIPGVQYLQDINEGRDPYPEGRKVVVIGGGNVAIDCVRCSLRIHKTDVHIVYRRTRNEMPAEEVEIRDAEAEAVQFDFLTAPVRVLAENNKVVGLECIRMELAEPDQSGRRRPVPIEGSEFVFDCDTIVPAIGQKIDLSLFDGLDGVNTTRWGTLVVDEVTKQSDRPKIFSAGDCETGPGALITACAGGMKAAFSIDRLINERPLEYDEGDYFDRFFKTVKVYDPDEKIEINEERRRHHLAMLAPETRKHTFDEVEKGFSTPEAIAEAVRCLRCYRVATIAV